MDYSQFLYMHEELSLLAVIVILFIADLFMCPDKKSGKGVYNTALPVVLLAIHTVLNLLPCCGAESTSAFGGMYQYTPMMTIMKSVLNVGTREPRKTRRVLYAHALHLVRYVLHDFERSLLDVLHRT